MEEFTKEYFKKNYGGNYFQRNPDYKQNSYLKKILKFKKKGKLLDVGCAYGLFLDKAGEYFECSGIDVSKDALQSAKKLLPQKTHLYQGRIENINIKEKFDVICCFDVLEHIQRLDNTLAKLNRYLNKDGILVISVPVYDGIIGFLVGLVDKDMTHIYKKSRKFWIGKLESCGFEICDYEGIFRYNLLKSVYLHHINSLIKGFSPAIFIIARK